MEKLQLTGKDLTFESIHQVVFDRRQVEISKEAVEKVNKARQMLFDLAAEGKPVYGLNRGVGWNKDKEFCPDFFEQYNRNLLNSHSLGIAPYNSEEETRAIMLIRLNKALNGCTGISIEILNMIVEFLNREIHPRIPRRGSIGEGDITTLSHLGLALIGEGEVIYRGEVKKSSEVIKELNLKPIILGPKDGLSILSSNAQGEAMAYILLEEVKDIIDTSNLIYCLSLEGLNGVIESLDEKVNQLRGLNGQSQSANQCREFLKGSYLHEKDENRVLQDPLSYRCGFSISGSVLDAWTFTKENLEKLVNSTDDNPCIVSDENRISVSSNFEVTTLALGVEMIGSSLAH